MGTEGAFGSKSSLCLIQHCNNVGKTHNPTHFLDDGETSTTYFTAIHSPFKLGNIRSWVWVCMLVKASNAAALALSLLILNDDGQM